MINISEYLINKQTKEQVNKFDQLFDLVKDLHNQGYNDALYINDNIHIDYTPVVHYATVHEYDCDLELIYFIYDAENDIVNAGVYSIDEDQEVECDIYELNIEDEDLDNIIKELKKL